MADFDKQPHVHITTNSERIGTLFLDPQGHVVDDGTPAAINAIDYTNHGFRREDGRAALDGIVAHLDRSTAVSASFCSDTRCGAGLTHRPSGRCLDGSVEQIHAVQDETA